MTPEGQRRVQVHPQGYLLMLDNWPDKGRHIISAAKLRQHAPRRVAGTARPYTSEFEEFLRARFLGAVR